jgi:hypothetical protein
MINHGILVGKITPRVNLTAKVKIVANLVGVVSKAKIYRSGYEEYQVYDGSYEVTPKVTEQSMYTKDKLMADDVKIKSIPFFSVSNETGGNTVYIGKEVI